MKIFDTKKHFFAFLHRKIPTVFRGDLNFFALKHLSELCRFVQSLSKVNEGVYTYVDWAFGKICAKMRSSYTKIPVVSHGDFTQFVSANQNLLNLMPRALKVSDAVFSYCERAFGAMGTNTQVRTYPTRPERSIPCTRYFWQKRYIITRGNITIIPAVFWITV